jgi:hypothetical protein
MTEPFSYRLTITWKNRLAWSLVIGKWVSSPGEFHPKATHLISPPIDIQPRGLGNVITHDL